MSSVKDTIIEFKIPEAEVSDLLTGVNRGTNSMVIVIRDDDTCGFTQPGEIQACYEKIWDDIPISLSVTPFRIPGNDKNLPKHLMGKIETLPLHENQELVQMLRAEIIAGRIDISMHGYHHTCYNGLPEYVGGEELGKKTRDGRTYLENLLGLMVSSFVPPNNAISKGGISAVIDAGMNLVNVPSLWSVRRRPMTSKTIRHIPVYYWHRKVRKMPYPYVLDMGNHKEVGYHTAGPRSRRKQLFSDLDYCERNNGVFVISTHYHAFDRKTQDGETVRALVFDLIDRAIAWPDTEFVGINTIW